MDPQLDYRFPRRKDYPQDTSYWTRRQYEDYLEPAEPKYCIRQANTGQKHAKGRCEVAWSVCRRFSSGSRLSKRGQTARGGQQTREFLKDVLRELENDAAVRYLVCRPFQTLDGVSPFIYVRGDCMTTTCLGLLVIARAEFIYCIAFLTIVPFSNVKNCIFFKRWTRTWRIPALYGIL
jgi:hypothetical protein